MEKRNQISKVPRNRIRFRCGETQGAARRAPGTGGVQEVKEYHFAVKLAEQNLRLASAIYKELGGTNAKNYAWWKRD